MENNKIKPGKWLFVLAGGIALFGILLTVFTTISLVKSSSNLERFIIPGNKEIYFEKTGEYIIYHEYTSKVDGQYFYSKKLQGFDCKIVNSDNGKDVKIYPNKSKSSYQFPEKEGIAIFNFTIDEPGNYNISAKLKNAENQTVLAIGTGKLMLNIFLVTISVFVLIFCLLAAKIIIIITFVMRRRNKTSSI